MVSSSDDGYFRLGPSRRNKDKRFIWEAIPGNLGGRIKKPLAREGCVLKDVTTVGSWSLIPPENTGRHYSTLSSVIPSKKETRKFITYVTQNNHTFAVVFLLVLSITESISFSITYSFGQFLLYTFEMKLLHTKVDLWHLPGTSKTSSSFYFWFFCNLMLETNLLKFYTMDDFSPFLFWYND